MDAIAPGMLRPRTEVESNLLQLISGAQNAQQVTVEPSAAKELETAAEEVLAEVEAEQVDIERPKELTAKQKKKLARFAATIERDAGDVIAQFQLDNIVPVSEKVTWEEDPELVCSYNWQETQDGKNTIFVPGEPPKWTPQTLPYTLEKDNGWSYTDYNYVRQPKDPYAPLFHALGVMNPDHQFMDVDVLADRNNLRVLLEFVQGKNNGPFRLNLYTVRNTLVITRREAKYWMHMSDQREASYGCSFEKTFTTVGKDMDDATNHYRALRYPLGPLSVVVRFEADAYYEDVPDDLTPTEVEAATGGLPAERPNHTYKLPFQVLQKGHIVPTTQIAELKTFAHRDDLNKKLVQCQDQLWFGRTTHLLTGRYEKETGKVVRLKYEDARERVKIWEDRNQEALRKLAALLASLKKVVPWQKGTVRGVVLAREDKDGPLIVRSIEEKHQAVQYQFFERHWKPASRPPPRPAQRGGYGANRGHVNIARGGSPHGRGQQHIQPGQNIQSRVPNEGHAQNNRGRGQNYRGNTRRTNPYPVQSDYNRSIYTSQNYEQSSAGQHNPNSRLGGVPTNYTQQNYSQPDYGPSFQYGRYYQPPRQPPGY